MELIKNMMFKEGKRKRLITYDIEEPVKAVKKIKPSDIEHK